MTRELCALLADAAAPCPDAARVPQLVALARTHRVHLVAAHQLARRTPTAVSGDLRAEMRVEALRDTLRVRELARVAAALEADGCDPVVFKGAALALTHYAESWLRPRVDADIVVAPAARDRAASVLGRLGYTRPAMTAGRLVMHQEMHVRSDATLGEHVVDLHWRLANPNLLAGLPSHGELRARATRALADDVPVAVASSADALVIACVHRAAHHGGSGELLWLLDISLLARRLSADEWRMAVDTARTGQVAALVQRGLELSEGAFGLPVPPDVRRDLRQAALVPEPSAVFLREDLRPLDRLRADVAALGAARGARLVAEHLFPPASSMRHKYRLRSDALLPLAYARRIVGGATGWFRKQRGRV